MPPSPARSLGDVRDAWATRDAAAEFKTVLGPHASYDIGLPVTAMDGYARDCRATLAQALPACAAFYSHIADGPMHIITHVPDAAEQPFDAMNQVDYTIVRRPGGIVSAEHSIGLKGKPYLPHARSAP